MQVQRILGIPRARRLGAVAIAVALAAAVLAPACGGGRTDGAALPPRVEAVYATIDAAFDESRAFGVVTHMDQYWRVAGNPGFDATVEWLRDGLVEGGFALGATPLGSRVWVESYPGGGHGWDYQTGTVRLPGDDEPVLSRGRDRVSLCINSFSTLPGGLTARLVDVGAGVAEGDYTGQDVKGAVVLGWRPTR